MDFNLIYIIDKMYYINTYIRRKVMKNILLFIVCGIFLLFSHIMSYDKNVNSDDNVLNGFGPIENNYNILSKAVQQKQNDKDYFKQGQDAAKNGNHRQAIEFFTKAIELNSDEVDYYIARGWSYYYLKDYKNATYDFTRAIELKRFDNDVEAYYGRGSAYYALRDYEQALFDLNKAIGLKSNYVAAYNRRGWLYYNKGDYENAISDFSYVIRHDRNNADAYYGRGSAYRKQGKNDLAQKDLQKACELSINYCKS
jgi:tetratricopeptide (TPR) repeat protein